MHSFSTNPAAKTWRLVPAAFLLLVFTLLACNLSRQRSTLRFSSQGKTIRVDLVEGHGVSQPYLWLLDSIAFPLEALLSTLWAGAAVFDEKLSLRWGVAGWLLSLLPGITANPRARLGSYADHVFQVEYLDGRTLEIDRLMCERLQAAVATDSEEEMKAAVIQCLLAAKRAAFRRAAVKWPVNGDAATTNDLNRRLHRLHRLHRVRLRQRF